jgi:hypothetical protein
MSSENLGFPSADGGGLPTVSAENFLTSEFEEKLMLVAQQYGSAGVELMRGQYLTDEDHGIPDGNKWVRVYVDAASKELIRTVERGDETEKNSVEDWWNETNAGKDPEEKDTETPVKVGKASAEKGSAKARRKIIEIELRRYKQVDKELYTAQLQNGLRKKEQHVTLKQRLCSMLILKLEKALRVSVQQHKEYAKAMNESDVIKLFAIVKECATGRGAQSSAILLFQLFQLQQKGNSVEDFEAYVKEFVNLVIDILKLGDPDKILEQLFDAKFVHGLKREMFKEHLAVPLSQPVWPKYQELAELLLRVVRTNRGFTEMSDPLSRAQKKSGNSDGTIVADVSKAYVSSIPEDVRGICFKCGKRDHRSRECTVDEPYCSKCGKKGNHLEKYHSYLVRSGSDGSKFSKGQSHRKKNGPLMSEKIQHGRILLEFFRQI